MQFQPSIHSYIEWKFEMSMYTSYLSFLKGAKLIIYRSFGQGLFKGLMILI